MDIVPDRNKYKIIILLYDDQPSLYIYIYISFEHIIKNQIFKPELTHGFTQSYTRAL